jgi:multidrug efflux system membrane fusion protein
VTENDTAIFKQIDILEDSEDGLWVTNIPNSVEIIVQGQGFVEDGQKVITNRL